MVFRSEILSTGEMAEADRLATAEGVSASRLMENAGRAVAEACLGLLGSSRGRRCLVVCGPGNNGGDGFVAARRLRDAGHEVRIAGLVGTDALKGEALAAARRWAGPVEALDGMDGGVADLYVDALFGAGLSRPLEGAAAAAVERLNASRKPIVAVDVPSGVQGDTGEVTGEAVQASTTVSFFRLKPAHLLLPGRGLCGTVILSDIGIPDDVLAQVAPRAVSNHPSQWLDDFPVPSSAGHKYSRGHALVVSGPMPMLGAARLAAQAAARIGAGLVTVASPADAVAAHAAHLTSIMLRPFQGAPGLAEILSDSRKNTVVLGPGLGTGEATRQLIEIALRPSGDGRGRAVVLDADALTSFEGDAQALARLIAAAPGLVVVTPHDGEFKRLFEGGGDEFTASSKLARARAGARQLGAVLLLKGADTVIASPDGFAAIACADAPWLATAGSGDVLAGMIAGLLAQGMPAFPAACAAVHLHAAAARHFGPGLISEDLPESLPPVLRRLLQAKSSGHLEPAPEPRDGLVEERGLD